MILLLVSYVNINFHTKVVRKDLPDIQIDRDKPHNIHNYEYIYNISVS
jgi:hypothetical protein